MDCLLFIVRNSNDDRHSLLEVEICHCDLFDAGSTKTRENEFVCLKA